MPFLRGSHAGGSIHRSPFASASRSGLGSTFEGGPCNEAGPAYALPIKGSYVLVWHGHAIVFDFDLYLYRHHKCRQTMLYSRNAETSFLPPPSSRENLISCHVRNASLFRTS